MSAASDPLIPLITKVPTSGIESDAVAILDAGRFRNAVEFRFAP